TLYGDTCGGISVIGGLSKVDVYRLTRHVNARHGRAIIPEETFTLKPSAELAPGQVDPFDYYVMAPVVSELAERRRRACDSRRALVGGGVAERRRSVSELIALFESRSLDRARFVPDPEGRTVYD